MLPTVLASIDYGFVLLANPKCATTALEQMYRSHANFDVGRNPKWKHMTWRQYRAIFGDFFDGHGCDTYAVVRDPIDLLHSWWRYRQRSDLQRPNHVNRHRSTVGVSFEEFVEQWASDDPPSHAVIRDQRSMLMTEQGDPAPLHYYRYDEVGRLIANLNERIGIDAVPNRLNESPAIETEIDRNQFSALPRIREQFEFVAAISFQ